MFSRYISRLIVLHHHFHFCIQHDCHRRHLQSFLVNSLWCWCSGGGVSGLGAGIGMSFLGLGEDLGAGFEEVDVGL